jgi:glycosyltransferase involved in cell wall biosynthesis
MNVLHVIPAVAQRYGGPSAAIRQECLALDALGAGTLIATTDADGPDRLLVTLNQIAAYDGVRTLFFSRLWSEAFKYAPEFARWIGQHARDFDVVHIRGVLSHVCLASARACRAANVPYVMEPLGTLDRWSLRQKPWRKRLLLAASGRRALVRASAIRCTSSEERREIESLFGVPTALVIPLAVDTARVRSASTADRQEDPYVLVLSRLHPVKGLELLIDAFAAATARNIPASKPWRLVIAGSGEPDYVRTLSARANASSAASRITFEGWVEGERKADLLARASLFALPSHHENFGVSLAEALACGVPAIVSPHVQLASTLTDTHSGWVSELSVGTLAAILRNVMSSPTLLKACSDAAHVLGMTFSSSYVGRQLVELYERIGPHESAVPPSVTMPAMTSVRHSIVAVRGETNGLRDSVMSRKERRR